MSDLYRLRLSNSPGLCATFEEAAEPAPYEPMEQGEGGAPEETGKQYGLGLIELEPAPTLRTSALLLQSIQAYVEFFHGQKRTFPVVSSNYPRIHAEDTQFSFDFMPDETPNNVFRFIRKSSQTYLDYGVSDIFRDVPELVGPAKKLEKRGIQYVGALVQMSREELAQFPFMTDDILDGMATHLAQGSLGFGMNIPWWNRIQQTPGRPTGR